MKILKFFRKTYNGEEYIIEEEGNIKRMKVIDKDLVGNFMEFSNYLSLLNYVMVFLKPERYEIENEKVVLYFAYNNEQPVEIENLSLSSKRALFLILLNLLQEIYHIPNLFFPIFSVDDILLQENTFVVQPPIWLSRNMVPEIKDRVFVAPEFLKKQQIVEKSTVYVIGKFLEKLNLENAEINKVIKEMVSEDVTKRNFHFGMPSVYKSFLEMNFVVPTIQRPELDVILKVVDYPERFIGVVGEQRMGKTTLINILQDRFMVEGKNVIRANNIKQFGLQLLQLAADKGSENVLSEISDIIKNGGKVDTLVPLVGSVMEEFDQIIILVDDYQEKFDNFKVFLKELSKLSFSGNHKIVAFSTEKFEDFEKVITLNPFSVEKVRELVEKSFGKIEKLDILVDFLHKVSSGLPGILVEVLGSLVEKKILRRDIEKNCWICDFERLENFSFENIFDVLSTLNAKDVYSLRCLSVLGQKFTVEEIKLLEKILNKDFSKIIELSEKKGILYREYSIWRFTLKQYWQKLYSQAERKKEIHQKLICECLKFDFFGVYQKVAWHFKMLGEERKAVIFYLKAIRRGLEKYYSPNILLKMISEAEDLASGKILYSLIRFKIEVYYRTFKKINFEVSDKEIFLYWRMAAKFVNQKNREIVEFFEENKEKLQGFGKIGTYRRILLYYSALYNLGLYDKIDISVLKEISSIKDVDSKFVMDLKIRALILLGNLLSRRDNLSSDYFYNTAEMIAKEKELYHFLPTIYNNKSFNIGNFVILRQLFDKSIYYSEKVGLTNLSIVSKINKIYTMLYIGNIREFFMELSRLRKIIKLKNMDYELAETYKLEVLYHIYNREFEEGYKDLMIINKISQKFETSDSYLKSLFMLYIFTGKVELARALYEEHKNEKSFLEWGFNYFVELSLATDEGKFKRVWDEYKDSNVFLWREEIFSLFGEKIAKVDPEGFFEQLRFFEKDYASQDLKLSLALLYEGFAKYYKVLGKSYRYSLYISKAYSLYREIGLENYVRILEKNESAGINSYLKKGQNISDMLQRQNISKGLKDYFFKSNFALEILEELKAIEEIEEPQNIINYFASKIIQILPVNEVVIYVEDRQIEEKFEFSNTDDILKDDMLKEDFIKKSPLRIRISDRIDKYLEYYIYISNKNLRISDEELLYILDLLKIVEYGFVTALKSSILRIRSLLDPLTKLYTRYYFAEKIDQYFIRAKKFREKMSIIMCDLDYFKQINDKYGHLVGDKVLKEVAHILKGGLRHKNDIVGRYGGEEFIILLSNTSSKEAEQIAERLRSEIELIDKFPFKITMSFGVACYPEVEVNTSDELVGYADDALYKAKDLGRNRVVVFEVFKENN
ncbi:GGDEF domain-containing protein [Thermosipho sp. 1223]|uniref:GGDEF domain-containing protein n=1 Tax=Thermosipho sp. 1223 TaxID=1643332 RepID=UPI000987356C|nr:GGDEF domain-containing protein [Thermosipho sp. 1223]OOC46374.1 diguanylate cyclase [Thermosipho sp. 1223]